MSEKDTVYMCDVNNEPHDNRTHERSTLQIITKQRQQQWNQSIICVIGQITCQRQLKHSGLTLIQPGHMRSLLHSVHPPPYMHSSHPVELETRVRTYLWANRQTAGNKRLKQTNNLWRLGQYWPEWRHYGISRGRRSGTTWWMSLPRAVQWRLEVVQLLQVEQK